MAGLTDMETAMHGAELALLRMSLTSALIRASVDDEHVLSITANARQLATGEVVCDVEMCDERGFPVGSYSL